MAKTTFQGPVKSINGFQGVGTGNSVSIGAGATSLTVDAHAGRMLYHNVAGAATLTLPAITHHLIQVLQDQVTIQTQRTI